MDLMNIATLIGQLLGVLFFAVMVYLLVMIPISLKNMARQLAEIKDELRKQNKQTEISNEN